ncbi:hypothetical protein CXG81DRAFT_16831 [Caulochytrium protostelioides]|uniref:RING-type domain-containing protein n=1 Tax=Caulochytrium protostelioides TaxID=1555241 RepID=A0A4P9XDZ1_9FUNG|nr:hypothetical protein CXG81DRAFT_16831 [Caulochytrium protostelioides]|eukprot:RKP03735.1 hypothetical protein CXG81DRAFT_16831 [Caulochytrium protostelioides]
MLELLLLLLLLLLLQQRPASDPPPPSPPPPPPPLPDRPFVAAAGGAAPRNSAAPRGGGGPTASGRARHWGGSAAAPGAKRGRATGFHPAAAAAAVAAVAAVAATSTAAAAAAAAAATATGARAAPPSGGAEVIRANAATRAVGRVLLYRRRGAATRRPPTRRPANASCCGDGGTMGNVPSSAHGGSGDGSTPPPTPVRPLSDGRDAATDPDAADPSHGADGAADPPATTTVETNLLSTWLERRAASDAARRAPAYPPVHRRHALYSPSTPGESRRDGRLRRRFGSDDRPPPSSPTARMAGSAAAAAADRIGSDGAWRAGPVRSMPQRSARTQDRAPYTRPAAPAGGDDGEAAPSTPSVTPSAATGALPVASQLSATSPSHVPFWRRPFVSRSPAAGATWTPSTPPPSRATAAPSQDAPHTAGPLRHVRRGPSQTMEATSPLASRQGRRLFPFFRPAATPSSAAEAPPADASATSPPPASTDPPMPESARPLRPSRRSSTAVVSAPAAAAANAAPTGAANAAAAAAAAAHLTGAQRRSETSLIVLGIRTNMAPPESTTPRAAPSATAPRSASAAPATTGSSTTHPDAATGSDTDTDARAAAGSAVQAAPTPPVANPSRSSPALLRHIRNLFLGARDSDPADDGDAAATADDTPADGRRGAAGGDGDAATGQDEDVQLQEYGFVMYILSNRSDTPVGGPGAAPPTAEPSDPSPSTTTQPTAPLPASGDAPADATMTDATATPAHPRETHDDDDGTAMVTPPETTAHPSPATGRRATTAGPSSAASSADTPTAQDDDVEPAVEGIQVHGTTRRAVDPRAAMISRALVGMIRRAMSRVGDETPASDAAPASEAAAGAAAGTAAPSDAAAASGATGAGAGAGAGGSRSAFAELGLDRLPSSFYRGLTTALIHALQQQQERVAARARNPTAPANPQERDTVTFWPGPGLPTVLIFSSQGNPNDMSTTNPGFWTGQQAQDALASLAELLGASDPNRPQHASQQEVERDVPLYAWKDGALTPYVAAAPDAPETSAAPADADDLEAAAVAAAQAEAAAEAAAAHLAKPPPTLIAATRERCMICLTEYEDGDLLRVMRCQHGFHKECLDQWLVAYNNSCPLCRNKAVGSEDAPDAAAGAPGTAAGSAGSAAPSAATSATTS